MNTLFQKMRNNRVKLEKASNYQKCLRDIKRGMVDGAWSKAQYIEPYEEQDRKNKSARALLDSIK